MKTIKSLTLLLLISCFGITDMVADKAARKAYYNNEFNYEIHPYAVGADKTKIFIVWGYAKKPADAIIMAKRNAVAAALFKGIAGNGEVEPTPAICTTPNSEEVHADFFNEFFDSGKYLQYVNLSSDAAPSGDNRLKMKNGYKVAVLVQILFDKLRSDMETAGIARKLDQGFSGKGAAKKPSVMVIPSDRMLISGGYWKDGEDKTAGFRKAFQTDQNINLVIAELGKLMAERGFPTVILEQKLKSNAKDDAVSRAMNNDMAKKGDDLYLEESDLDRLMREAGCDIILNLDYKINRVGPEKSITFILQGLDAYTNTQITSASGSGKASTSASVSLLLEEAVLNYIDSFNDGLMSYFSNMFTNGRQTAIEIRVASSSYKNLSSTVNYNGDSGSLSDLIEMWLSENCVNGVYNSETVGQTRALYTPVNMPLMGKGAFGKGEKAITTGNFANSLAAFLQKELNIKSSVHPLGLGKATLVIE